MVHWLGKEDVRAGPSGRWYYLLFFNALLLELSRGVVDLKDDPQ
jgi:hypothetical protein